MAIRVRFDDPNHGWIGISIEYQGASFDESFSYAGYDTFEELVLALTRLLLPRATVSVTCLVGPAEFDLRFERDGDVVHFAIVEYPDHGRQKGAGQVAFSASGTFQQICIPFWRALRELEGRFSEEELARRWHREFPHDRLRRLTGRIKSEKP